MGGHAGLFDEVRAVQIAPDADAERPFLPDPSTRKDHLLLGDRGYPSVPYSEAVREQGGSFIVRLMRSYDPWVRTAWVDGRQVDVSPARPFVAPALSALRVSLGVRCQVRT